MLQLRPYQVASIDALREGFRQGHVRQVLCASTGSGKSIIMLAMIQAAIEKGSRVLFMCERRVLVEQFSKHLDKNGIEHGVLMADSFRFRPQEKVQVASIQTLERMDSLPAFDVGFADELHVMMRKSVINLIKTRPNLKIIGSTATPFNPKIAEHFTSITNVITMRELTDDGYLLPFRVFIAHEIDTKGIKVVAGEWAKDEVESKSLQIVGDVVSDYLDISNRLYGRHAKAICFSAGVAHGAELVKKFAEAGVNAVQLSYKDDQDYKDEALREFARHDTEIDVVISSDLLTRGYDETSIEHVILARPLRKSFSSFVQMIGRGARPHDNMKFCTVQDNSGNWLRFKDQWDKLYSEGVSELLADVEAKAPKEPSEREKKAAKCPVCTALMAGDKCPVCGFVRVPTVKIGTVAGEMLELTGHEVKKEKFTSEFKEAFYQGLLFYCRQKGWKDGRAFYLYKEKFNIEPAWKKIASPPNQEVLNHFKYLAIKNAKGRK